MILQTDGWLKDNVSKKKKEMELRTKTKINTYL
jgi:hypothetical protein